MEVPGPERDDLSGVEVKHPAGGRFRKINEEELPGMGTVSWRHFYRGRWLFRKRLEEGFVVEFTLCLVKGNYLMALSRQICATKLTKCLLVEKRGKKCQSRVLWKERGMWYKSTQHKHWYRTRHGPAPLRRESNVWTQTFGSCRKDQANVGLCLLWSLCTLLGLVLL